MSKFGAAAAFFCGVAVGGAAAWYCARKTYSAIAEREIESVKESFARREKRILEKSETPEPAPTPAVTVKVPKKESISEYAKKACEGESFTKYAQTQDKKPESYIEAPYVISPDEFGELDGYTVISLYYFDDGVLSDENGIIIEDPEEIVGDGLERFGEYEEDSVYVRSDPKRCDYEILRDLHSYAEFRSTLPPNI